MLPVGDDKTLDDGTAAAKFPTNLPGNATGELDFMAKVLEPPALAGAEAHLPAPGGRIIHQPAEPFPRVLWGPRSPPAVIAVVGVIVGAVWLCYAYVAVQLLGIRFGGRA